MTIVNKSYWKWDKKYNSSKFVLGKHYSQHEIRKEFEFIKGENGINTFQSLEHSQLTIEMKGSKIVRKDFPDYLPVENVFYNAELKTGKFEFEIEGKLERVNKNYLGEKLILCYVDGLLKHVILKTDEC